MSYSEMKGPLPPVSGKRIRVLHFEDDPNDALLARLAMEQSGASMEVIHAMDAVEFQSALALGDFDLILSDNGLPGFSGTAVLNIARQKAPGTPFVFLSGVADDDVRGKLAAGAADLIGKDSLWRLTNTIRNIASERSRKSLLERQNQGMKRLVMAVQDLSLARNLDAVMSIVRRAARELTGADGATFVLRDGNQCFYAEEDAIAPLWKGQRFPMSACISGWVMLNKQPTVIEDIYADSRIPADAYRPTFVKSLVMVPVRTQAPMAAIGNYWAAPHLATPDEVELLQALANTTAVALEDIQLFGELEERVRERTRQLEETNRELEAFSYSVSHDLRSPLQHITGFAEILEEQYGPKMDDKARDYLNRIVASAERMGGLITDLLRLANFAQAPLKADRVNLSEVAARITDRLRAEDPARCVEFRLEKTPEVAGDPGLLQVVMENLLSNAWKYTAGKQPAVIEFGSSPDAPTTYFVRDNGAGFDMKYADKLFGPFQRLHKQSEFAGHGVGLATVRRIIHRHGGSIRAEAEPGKGATFFFSLGLQASNSQTAGL